MSLDDLTGSPLFEQIELPPVHVVVATADGPPLVDDAGALPLFAWRSHAEIVAEALAAVLPDAAVLAASRAFIADELLALDGREAEELTDAETDALTMRTYFFEVQVFDDEDAREQAVELAARILRGIERRRRAEDDTT